MNARPNAWCGNECAAKLEVKQKPSGKAKVVEEDMVTRDLLNVSRRASQSLVRRA